MTDAAGGANRVGEAGPAGPAGPASPAGPAGSAGSAIAAGPVGSARSAGSAGLAALVGGREARLGIDIGRVIINGPGHPGGGDTAFFAGDEATMLATPEMEGAVVVIAGLVSLFGGRVWLVSKCGPRVQARTLRWLAGHDFYGRTGLPADQVRFCRARPDKRQHCLELGLTHFVDDHPEVHAAIRGTVDGQYFFGPQREPVPGYGIHAASWAELDGLIRASLDGRAGSGMAARNDGGGRP